MQGSQGVKRERVRAKVAECEESGGGGERAGRVKGILPFYGNGSPIFLRYCTGLGSGLLLGRLEEPLSRLFCCKYNRKGAFNAAKRRSSAYARTLR